MNKKIFSATLEYLHDMLNFVKDFCLKKGFEPSVVNKIVVAVEEAVVNVIHHGYKDGNGIIEIICEESEDKPGVKIVIIDHCEPFNPMEKVSQIKKGKHHLVEDISIGGYGIFLYVEIMDQVEYKRNENVNFLCLIKYL